jgi:hypothetical protein
MPSTLDGFTGVSNSASSLLSKPSVLDSFPRITNSASVLLNTPSVIDDINGVAKGVAILATNPQVLGDFQSVVNGTEVQRANLTDFAESDVASDDLGVVTFSDLSLTFKNETGEKINVIAYNVIYGFERGLRALVDRLMDRSFGSNWIRQRIPADVSERWKERRANAVANGEDERPLLEYADFTDYAEIVNRRDNWSQIFQAVFRNKEDVLVSLRRLNAVRIPVMHSRQITEIELLRTLLEIDRLRKAAERAGYAFQKMDS